MKLVQGGITQPVSKFWLCPQREAHHVNESAGAHSVAYAQPVMEVRVISSTQVVLDATVVGLFIDHEAATLYSDGVAAAQLTFQVSTVITALKMAPAEVLALIKDDLDMEIVLVLFENRFVLPSISSSTASQFHAKIYTAGLSASFANFHVKSRLNPIQIQIHETEFQPVTINN